MHSNYVNFNIVYLKVQISYLKKSKSINLGRNMPKNLNILIRNENKFNNLYLYVHTDYSRQDDWIIPIMWVFI